MKKILALTICVLFCSLVSAKTTYIPTYIAYMHIVNKEDTISTTGNLPVLDLASNNNMFTIRVEHELVTKEKIKEIKRKKRAAGWMGFASIMGGISTGLSDNVFDYVVRSSETQYMAYMADIYQANANESQVLEIDIWIDNHFDEEIMVNDMDRGLTWYIQPHESLQIPISNPDALRLRISDLHHTYVNFANVVAGSKLTKYELGWEDNDCWIVINYDKTTSNEIKIKDYTLINKIDYRQEKLTRNEFEKLKNELKAKSN